MITHKLTGDNKLLLNKAKELRKCMTKEEKKLWFNFLRNYPIKFYRQRIINNYIVDFYCSKARLVIELDGMQHYEEKALIYDKHRTDVINQYGIEVIRFTNREINENFEGVVMVIENKIKEKIGR